MEQQHERKIKSLGEKKKFFYRLMDQYHREKNNLDQNERGKYNRILIRIKEEIFELQIEIAEEE